MFEKQTQQSEYVAKPWGHEIIWARTGEYVGKVLFIKAGETLSLQYHELKEETMFLESGEVRLEVGDDVRQLQVIAFPTGSSFHIPPGLLHRLTAITDCRIFEVSTPHLSDVVRVQDRYGRK